MKRIHLLEKGSQHRVTRVLFIRLVVLLSFLAFVACRQLALAAESGEPKNVLVLYSFSDRGLFDPLDHLKSAIRSRLSFPVNFYVHYSSGSRPDVNQMLIQWFVNYNLKKGWYLATSPINTAEA